MPEVMLAVFNGVILFFVIEILVTALLGYKMIERAVKNHLEYHEWRLALLSMGIFLICDAFNDTFWAYHLVRADVMQKAPELFWSMLPAIVVSTAAIFMCYSFWSRSQFFEGQIAKKEDRTGKLERKDDSNE
jgi:CDP-diglyceride synthetase